MMHLESITIRNKVHISPPFPEEEEEEDTRCKFAPLEVARADNRIIFRQLQADRRRRRRRSREGMEEASFVIIFFSSPRLLSWEEGDRRFG